MPDAKEISEQNRKVYDSIAAHFAITRRKIAVDISGLADYTKAGDMVLDIGCGTGRLYDYLKHKDVHYLGIDQSSGQIEEAKKAYPMVKFRVAEMTELPCPDGLYDIVYCIAALHHLPDKASRVVALKEMKRVAKPGAHVVLTNWNMHGDFAMAKIEKGEWRDIGEENFTVPWKDSNGIILGERIYHRFTSEELKKLFLEAGLEILNQNTEARTKDGLGAAENIVSILKA